MNPSTKVILTEVIDKVISIVDGPSEDLIANLTLANAFLEEQGQKLANENSDDENPISERLSNSIPDEVNHTLEKSINLKKEKPKSVGPKFYDEMLSILDGPSDKLIENLT